MWRQPCSEIARVTPMLEERRFACPGRSGTGTYTSPNVGP